MAGGVNFSGVGSGIDFGVITDSIIAQRSRPIQQLQIKQAELRGRSEALRQLNARLIALTSAARSLTDRTTGTGRTAVSSNGDILTSTSTDAATPSAINIEVQRLATSLTQATRTFTSTEPILAGGESSVTFVLRKGGAGGTDKNITIDSSNNTLEGLRTAINAAGADVTASVIDVSGSGDLKLVLTSKSTGAAGRVELIDPTNSASFNNLTVASLNPPGATTDFSDLNASLVVNNLTVTRPSNTISDVISGVTFNLKKEGEATVTISAATSALADKLRGFIDAYNAVQEFISNQYVQDDKGRPSGVLAGDPTLREAQRRIREALGADSTANGGMFTNLTQIGIGRDATGKVSLDRIILDDKLKNSFGDVQALLSGKTASDEGVAQQLVTSYEALSDNVTGTVQAAINGYTASLKSIDENIASQQVRLDALRASLTRRFAAADAAIGQLNGQGSALTNVLKSLEPRDK